MTLLKELSLYLTVLLILLFGSSLFVSIKDARNYHQEELKSHAQDTATALGVAIAAIDEGSIALIDSMVDAVFDRGYYQSIRFVDSQNQVLVSSEHALVLDDLPSWFISLTALTATEVSTDVNHGWTRIGTLHVMSHPGYAYRSLWIKSRNSFYLFGACLLMAIIGLNILLRIILKPLEQLESQANAICHKRFEVQSTLPKTRELRRVVEAMNRMASKLEQLFSEEMAITEEARQQSIKPVSAGVIRLPAEVGKWSLDQWHKQIKGIIESQSISLYSQPLVSWEGKVLFYDTAIKFEWDGHEIEFKQCGNIIETIGLGRELDTLTVRLLLKRISQQPEGNVFCVHVSPESLFNETFYDWLVDTLQKAPELSRRLVIGIPERALLMAGDNLAIVINDLLKIGVRFCVDHFGVESRSMGSLHVLQLDYVKIDNSFVDGVSENRSSQLFIHTVSMLAQSRDITLLAQGVDREADWHQLIESGVNGGQGAFLGKPDRL